MIKVISAFIILVLLDMRNLLKAQNRKKIMVVYFLLVIVGLGISLIVITDVPVKNPSQIIEDAVKSILKR